MTPPRAAAGPPPRRAVESARRSTLTEGWAMPAGAPPFAHARGNLPAALAGLVGREPELVELRRQLEETRLLTLTGAGGVGKTRLALAAARAAADDHPDGVWLVELAAVLDPALAARAVADVLRVRERPGRPPL